ncbi:hypothetical protein [Shewanella acanthi]|uniref:hypothetical protein n=1 Tax=Shewanella acanthi TaxID=2864212 RepID=UPI001C65886D|nr:hypothetical protein [Shewanella acanthi]QYJ78261.1 hypothetical protein K0H61_14285 [Shewanella acanthi]
MSIISNAKEVAELVKKLGDIELYRKIVELEGEIIDLSRTNHALQIEVDELKKKVLLNKSLSFNAPFYYSEGDATPYCPKCWESEGKAVHLVNEGYHSDLNQTAFGCVPCKHTYWYNGRHA